MKKKKTETKKESKPEKTNLNEDGIEWLMPEPEEEEEEKNKHKKYLNDD